MSNQPRPFPYHYMALTNGELLKPADEKSKEVYFRNCPGHDPLELFAFEKLTEEGF